MYQRVKYQLIIAGMGEPIGINHLAVEFIFKCYGIENRNDLWIHYLDMIEFCYDQERRIAAIYKERNKSKETK